MHGTVVLPGDGPEPLLACGIPKAELDASIPDTHLLHSEVNTCTCDTRKISMAHERKESAIQ
jgi:hypothetical protein